MAASLHSAAPESLQELRDCVAAAPCALAHGAQTKPALCAAPDGVARIDMTRLRGITDYQPEEFIFSALAGTPLATIQAALAEHGQYLPFDPPLAAQGATIGGAVASGLSGPARVRYGGIRDFIIGAKFIDGFGRDLATGGKVVKNAAGFDFPKLFTGSMGRFGILHEVTFKVFPEPRDYLTLTLEMGHIERAIETAAKLAGGHFDVIAVDISPPGQVLVRLGGSHSANEATAGEIERSCEVTATRTFGDGEVTLWNELRDFEWAKGDTLLKIPVTTRRLSDLDFAFGRLDARRHYSAAGNVAYAALNATQIAGFGEDLKKLRLPGLILRGNSPTLRIGHNASASAEHYLKNALDPDGHFPPLT